MKTRDGILIFDDHRNIDLPVVHVRKVNSNNFEVIYFKDENEIMNQYLSDYKELSELYDAVYNDPLPSRFNAKDIIKKMFHDISTTVFNGGAHTIQDSTPMFIFKMLKMTKEQLFNYLVGELQMQVVNFHKWFGKIEESESVKHIKLGNWNVYHDYLIKPEFIIQIMNKVESILSRIGCKELAYGNIHFLKQRIGHGKYLGDYFESNDSVRVTVDNVTESVTTIIHELGHRKYNKFLKAKNIKMIFEMFKDIKLGKTSQIISEIRKYLTLDSMKNVDEFFSDLFVSYTFGVTTEISVKNWMRGILA